MLHNNRQQKFQCFVLAGDKLKMGDIMGDDQFWRHTSRPTKYFYSEDMRRFFRVNCITAKGKIISAKLAGSATLAGGVSLGVPAERDYAPNAAASTSASRRESLAFGALAGGQRAAVAPPPPSSNLPGAAAVAAVVVAGASSTPRASLSVAAPPPSARTSGARGEKVPLEHVYKVIRFYR